MYPTNCAAHIDAKGSYQGSGKQAVDEGNVVHNSSSDKQLQAVNDAGLDYIMRHTLGTRGIFPDKSKLKISDGFVLAAYMFIPLGARANYYLSPAQWRRFRLEDVAIPDLSDAAHLVHCLFLNTYYCNARAMENLKIATEAKNMFNKEQYNNLTIHNVLQTLVLDRFVFAQIELKQAEPNIRPNDHLSSSIDEMTGGFKSLWKKITVWPELLWEAAQHIRSSENLKDHPRRKSKTFSVLSSLGERLAETKNASRVNHMEGNFIGAALGLLALGVVSQTNIIQRLKDQIKSDP